MMNKNERAAAGLQVLVDFSSGEAWRLPVDLLEDYERFVYSLAEEKRLAIVQTSSLLQYWIIKLPKGARERLTMVKSAQHYR